MIEYEVQSSLSQSQIELLVSKLHYSIPSLHSCVFSKERRLIVLELDPLREAEAHEVIRDIERDILKVSVPPVVILRSNLASHYLATRAEFLITQFADGAILPGARDICDRLRGALQNLCSHHTECDLTTYQTAIQMETMLKCDYIHRFPQNIYSVYQYPHDYRVLTKVRGAEHPIELAAPSGLLLSPATCFHCYETLANTAIDDDTTFLATSRCFRHESPWRLGGHRLREFEMLELVIFGSRTFVEQVRTEMIERVWRFFERVGLYGEVISAQDPFYFTEDASLANYQAAGSMKYELLASVGSNEVAIASFNTVGTTLSRQFSIHTPSGKLPHSGCVAFGIERWAFALMSLYGSDFANWPTEVKSNFKTV